MKKVLLGLVLLFGLWTAQAHAGLAATGHGNVVAENTEPHIGG